MSENRQVGRATEIGSRKSIGIKVLDIQRSLRIKSMIGLDRIHETGRFVRKMIELSSTHIITCRSTKVF